MGKPSIYSHKVRDRAVRIVLEHRGEYASQWAGMAEIIKKLMTGHRL